MDRDETPVNPLPRRLACRLQSIAADKAGLARASVAAYRLLRPDHLAKLGHERLRALVLHDQHEAALAARAARIYAGVVDPLSVEPLE